MTTLEAVLRRRPGFEETMDALAEGFRREHGLVLAPGGLTVTEMERAEALVREKYGTERWTRAGRAMTARDRGGARGRRPRGRTVTFTREYPDAPRVGVGAVILDGDRVLLVKRGQAPVARASGASRAGSSTWASRIEDAVRREVARGVRGAQSGSSTSAA